MSCVGVGMYGARTNGYAVLTDRTGVRGEALLCLALVAIKPFEFCGVIFDSEFVRVSVRLPAC